ncbi:MAG: VOC family protein [Alphaproteobacteria bacterium]|nr:VOC family protein [Alphaproteobacteria bacterium]
MSVALANSADVQLELIQQRRDTPSMDLDLLEAGHEGMQHWSSWPDDYDEKLQRALSNGYSIG